MKQIKEIGIPLIIWLFFIPQSIIGGLNFASLKLEPNEPMPQKFRIIVLSAAFFMGFIITLVNYLRPQMEFERKLEKILSEESYKIIGKRLKLYLLGSLFFGLFGISGLIKCHFINAPTINVQILQVPVVVGIGILCGRLVSLLIKSKHNKANSADAKSHAAD